MKRQRSPFGHMTPKAPMLVTRGITNDREELVERMAIESIRNGKATPAQFAKVANMSQLMLLAGSTSPARKWAFDYCSNTVEPMLQRIAQRYTRTNVISATTAEKAVLKSFGTKYRDFWLHQPTELMDAAKVALRRHYDEHLPHAQEA